MAAYQIEQNPGARIILFLAASVVVVAGLNFGAPILLPTVFALFLTILTLPVMWWLLRRGLPRWAAVLLTVLLTVALASVLILLAAMSGSELQRAIGGEQVTSTILIEGDVPPLEEETGALVDPRGRPPTLVDRLLERRNAAVAWIQGVQEEWNLPFEPVDFAAATRDLVNPQAVLDLVAGALERSAQVVSNAFIVFIVLAFMLTEATVLPRKLRQAFGEMWQIGERPTRIAKEIQTYLVIKTGASVTTGLVLGGVTHMMNLEFPILLGMIAFILNYIPTVGSIIAAIPAIMLSFLLHGTLGHALGVTVGYAVVNVAIGNILEPNLMGRQLGISTLAVILSLLFWGWLWGPVGALLSVPLTAVLKIWLEHTPDLRWVAALLDKGAGPEQLTPARRGN